MLTHISSTPQVRGRSVTHTQSLPRHRLSIMLSQNARRHVPSYNSSTHEEVTYGTCSARSICRPCRPRLGGCQTRCLLTSSWHCTACVSELRTPPCSHRRVGPHPAHAIQRTPCRWVPGTP